MTRVSADIPDHLAGRQQPVGSPFGATSTAADVLAGVDLTGCRALVTGGYAGIGLALVRALADAGATVVAPARRPEVAEAALADVPGVEVGALDLSDQASVAAFAGTQTEPLDLLVLNAGVMACPETRTAEGWELQLATNHLGHFALVNRLLPLLTDGAGNLVVPTFKTPEQGAATTAFAAVSPLLADRGGEYLEDCEVAPFHLGEGLGDHGVRPWAVDPEEAARLWTWSAGLTGVDALA